MSFADIYYQANEQLQLSNLTPLNQELFDKVDKEQWQNDSSITYAQWKQRVESVGYDVGKIYKNNNPASMRQFFYVEEYSATEIHMLEPVFLSSDFALPMLQVNQHNKKKFEQGDYTLLFFPEWNTFAIDYFVRLHKEIKKEQLWDVFLLIYTYANFGFTLFPDEVLQEVFCYADKEESIDRLRKEEKVDRNGFLTVYRGEGLRSTAIEKAYSWTLSSETAYKFANHFGQGRVYKAKVPVSQIISYQTERDEAEVLLTYHHLVELHVEQDYNELYGVRNGSSKDIEAKRLRENLEPITDTKLK